MVKCITIASSLIRTELAHYRRSAYLPLQASRKKATESFAWCMDLNLSEAIVPFVATLELHAPVPSFGLNE